MKGILVMMAAAFTVSSAPTHHQTNLKFYDDKDMTTSRQLEEHLSHRNVPFTRILSRNEFDPKLHLHVDYKIEFKDRKSAEETLPRSMELIHVKSQSSYSQDRLLVLLSGNNKFVFMKAKDRLNDVFCSKTRSSNRDQKDCDRSIENIVKVLFRTYTTEILRQDQVWCKDNQKIFYMNTRRCVEKLRKLMRRTTV